MPSFQVAAVAARRDEDTAVGNRRIDPLRNEVVLKGRFRAKAFFNRAFSIVSRPTICSSSLTWTCSSLGSRSRCKARSGSRRSCCRHLLKSVGWISCRRATAATEAPGQV